MALTARAEAFRTQGYYLAQQLVPRNLVESVKSGLDRLVGQQLVRLGFAPVPGATDAAVYANLKSLLSADLKAYLASLTLSAKLFEVHAMVIHQNIADLMRELGIEFPVFQSSPVLHIMSHALKIPGGYSGVGAHQDWPALQGSLDTITIWIPLVDVSTDLFPLEFIPGSHVRGLYEGETKEHIFEVAPTSYSAEDFISVDTRRGDALLFSSFLLHRSGQTGGDGVRMAISARYENAAEPTFIDRLYPFAQKRSVQRDLIVPDFPSRGQVAKIYDRLPQSR